MNEHKMSDPFVGLFKIRVPSPAPIQDEVLFGRAQRAERAVAELRDLNQKRLTKIRRLREGIRSYQRCHERDQLALRAARSRIYELEGQVKSLKAVING